MDPKKTMVGCRNGEELLDLRQVLGCVCLLETHEEQRQIGSIRGNMAADLDAAGAEFTRNNPDPLAGIGISDFEEPLGQAAAEPIVQPLQVFDRGGCELRILARIDGALHLDMRPCLELEFTAVWILRVRAGERPLDVARMGVVSFDEVRVVAVHRPHQIADSVSDPAVQLPGESAGFRDELKRNVRKLRLWIAGEHRFYGMGLHEHG